MASFWWASVSQATAAALLGVVVFSRVVGVVFRKGSHTKKYWICFSENYSRGHRGFKIIIDVVYGFFIIEK